MSTTSPVETASTYLNFHLTHAVSVGARYSARPFVTISRESGAGGSTLARALLDRLSLPQGARTWTTYSANLMAKMLHAHHLPGDLTRFLPEDRIPAFDASVGELVGLHPNLWELVANSNELIRQLAEAGGAIFIGRGANFATKGISHGVHIRLIASPEYRAACTSRTAALSLADAMKHNAHLDAERRRYVRSTFDADISSPTGYHLIINTERVALPVAVETIVSVVNQMESTDQLESHAAWAAAPA